jgi:hypothetical protein
MTAGLPGVGIGGLFYLISALLMPILEVVRTVRGRSSLARWRTVGRQFAMAVVMVGALTAVVWVLHAMTGPQGVAPAGAGPGTGAAGSGAEAAPGRSGFSPLLVMASWLMLTAVLGGAYVLRLVVARRRAPALAEPIGR